MLFLNKTKMQLQWTDFKPREYCFFSNRHNAGTKVGDMFIGFHEDTCPAIILHVIGQKPQAKEPEVYFLYLYI